MESQTAPQIQVLPKCGTSTRQAHGNIRNANERIRPFTSSLCAVSVLRRLLISPEVEGHRLDFAYHGPRSEVAPLRASLLAGPGRTDEHEAGERGAVSADQLGEAYGQSRHQHETWLSHALLRHTVSAHGNPYLVVCVFMAIAYGRFHIVSLQDEAEPFPLRGHVFLIFNQPLDIRAPIREDNEGVGTFVC